MIKLKNFDLSRAGRQLCRDLNIQFEANQHWVVLGPNGAGKSTLLHTLAGLLTADNGIGLCGKPVADWPPRARAQKLGILFQHVDLHFPMTVFETALIGRHPHIPAWHWERDKDYEITREALRTVDLEHCSERLVSALSGGELRRLSVAILLTQNPPILLLDEPNNHLDTNHLFSLFDHLDGLREQGRLLITATHDPNLASRYATHTLLLFEDQTYLAGDCREVLSVNHLSRLYDHPYRALDTESHTFFLPD